MQKQILFNYSIGQVVDFEYQEKSTKGTIIAKYANGKKAFYVLRNSDEQVFLETKEHQIHAKNKAQQEALNELMVFRQLKNMIFSGFIKERNLENLNNLIHLLDDFLDIDINYLCNELREYHCGRINIKTLEVIVYTLGLGYLSINILQNVCNQHTIPKISSDTKLRFKQNFDDLIAELGLANETEFEDEF